MALPEQMVPQAVDPAVVARIVTDVYQLCRADDSGELADYIPELAAAQPDSFGLRLATADGRVYGTGDVSTEAPVRSGRYARSRNRRANWRHWSSTCAGSVR